MTGSPARVVSLLPSATEIAVALGLGPQLVGRSHECDFPSFVRDLPVLTATKIRKGLSSIEIEHRVRDIVAQGLSVYEVDTAALQALRPDVILTQAQCAVCAVTPADLEEALATWTGTTPTLVSLAPDDLRDVRRNFEEVGQATGRSREADQAVADLKERLARLAEGRWGLSRPRVAAIEWIEPLMIAGNWVPELIQAAGGEPLFVTPGQHSPRLDWEAFVQADPDIIMFVPCGFQIDETLANLEPLTRRPGWNELRAIRDGRVFVADGHHLFNRPGPRLVESAEVVAEALAGSGPREAASSAGWIRLE